MVYPKRGSVPTNTIKLTLDFRTLDKLRAVADARKVDTTRCAYELLQAVLETTEIPDCQVQQPNLEPEDRVGELIAHINRNHTLRGRS